MESIAQRLDIINQRIRDCCNRKNKDVEDDEIVVIAASKTQHKEKIIEAYQHNVRHFGENYVNEICEKSADSEILEMCPDINWHFIGHLQTNKVQKLLKCPRLYMLHCIDSVKLADIVNKEWAKTSSEPLRVMIQVNTSKESSKSGVTEEEVEPLAKHIIENCHALVFKGFMTIGSPNLCPVNSNPEYQKLATIQNDVSKNYNLEDLKLSMGMSNDYLQAIEQGAHYVRIGEGIFGPREKKQDK